MQIINYSNLNNEKLAKKDYKWVLYEWLKADNSSNLLKTKTLESLFQSFNTNTKIDDLTLFFNKLYLLTYYFSILNNNSSLFQFFIKFNTMLNNCKNSTNFDFFNYFLFLNNSVQCTTPVYYYYFNIQKNKFNNDFIKSNSISMLTNKNNWNLHNLITETFSYNLLLNNKDNFFYFNALTLRDFNAFFINLIIFIH